MFGGMVIESFGATPAGVAVRIVTLTNRNGVVVRATTLGASIVSLLAPDRLGRLTDVVLGYDSLDGYLNDPGYFGAIIGRYANRIAHASFTIDGVTYRLVANDGPNHLHGGPGGFHRVVWGAAPIEGTGTDGVEFSTISPDGDQGYPGTLHARVRYTLTDSNELIVDYQATTDKATPVNLTQHSYFNLAGEGDIHGHLLQINADSMIPVDQHRIPTGGIAPVAGGPFDFRSLTPVGARISSGEEQLRRGDGYDHNFVLNRGGPGLLHAARLLDPVSGRTLDIRTTEPGLQFYSGNFLDGRLTGKAGRPHQHRGGLCLEPQHYPDSPNHPAFPDTILRPGSRYSSRTIYALSVTS